MKKDASFKELIEMCNNVGWDKGIESLERIVLANENLQAELFAGNYNQQKQAQKLSKVITQQNFTIAKLKQYRVEHNL